MSVIVHLLALLAGALEPLFATFATAAAIVVATVCVRALLHPLARAGARAERARARLAPQTAGLRKRHAADPERLRRVLLELHTREGVSPAAGCLPMLAQLPVFFVMYRLFTAERALLHRDRGAVTPCRTAPGAGGCPAPGRRARRAR
ncbi:YidC/Oxa1 family membrane protein insertase [Streptomyces barkulensis]|uniref:YidC/Oxa1 family membrane protein insertase n=1 Tax=Streptomyces barkulensis TaxID=1257026 RepID=UPI000C6D6836|nr:YidC/Oxa1 family membrane protein insertase [Streptomyces barkulensis]